MLCPVMPYSARICPCCSMYVSSVCCGSQRGMEISTASEKLIRTAGTDDKSNMLSALHLTLNPPLANLISQILELTLCHYLRSTVSNTSEDQFFTALSQSYGKTKKCRSDLSLKKNELPLGCRTATHGTCMSNPWSHY